MTREDIQRIEYGCEVARERQAEMRALARRATIANEQTKAALKQPGGVEAWARWLAEDVCEATD